MPSKQPKPLHDAQASFTPQWITVIETVYRLQHKERGDRPQSLVAAELQWSWWAEICEEDRDGTHSRVACSWETTLQHIITICRDKWTKQRVFIPSDDENARLCAEVLWSGSVCPECPPQPDESPCGFQTPVVADDSAAWTNKRQRRTERRIYRGAADTR